MKLSERIYTLRKSKGLTQDELAFYCQVSRQAVSKWEATDAKPDIDSIMKLSELFEMSVDEFLTGEVKKNKEQSRFNKFLLVIGIIIGFIIGSFTTFVVISLNHKEEPADIQPIVQIVDCDFQPLNNGMYSIELFVNEQNVDNLSLNIMAQRYDYTKTENLRYNEEKMSYYAQIILSKDVSYDINLVVNHSRQIALFRNIRMQENTYNNDLYYDEMYKDN